MLTVFFNGFGYGKGQMRSEVVPEAPKFMRVNPVRPEPDPHVPLKEHSRTAGWRIARCRTSPRIPTTGVETAAAPVEIARLRFKAPPPDAAAPKQINIL